jgi:hypothetical protein
VAVATRTGLSRTGADSGGVLLERDRELGLLDQLIRVRWLVMPP